MENMENTKNQTSGLENSAVIREMLQKQAKQNTILFWVCLAGLILAIAGTVILWNKVNNQNLEGIEPVQVRVVEVVKNKIKINGNTTTVYETTVEYDGKEYPLKGGGNSPWTIENYKGTAYLYEGNIYASEDATSTGTIAGKLYFVFLFASLGLLFLTPTVGSKASKLKKQLNF